MTRTAGLARRAGRKLGDVLAYLALGLLTAFSLGPILWLVLTSLKPEADIVRAGIEYIPHHVTYSNFVAIWEESGFPQLILNSAITTLYTLILCLGVGVPASYALSRLTFRGRKSLLLGFLSVRMFPAVLVVIPLFVVLRTVGLLDTRLGLALAYTSFLLPIFIWLLKGFLDAVPRDLEDAARVDGCTRAGAMLRIVLPLIRNGLAASGVFVAIAAWNEFLFALMLTTSGGARTWPVGLQLMVGEFQLPWGVLAAGGVLSMLPVMLLFAAVQRTMVSGLTAGAIKG